MAGGIWEVCPGGEGNKWYSLGCGRESWDLNRRTLSVGICFISFSGHLVWRCPFDEQML